MTLDEFEVGYFCPITAIKYIKLGIKDAAVSAS